MQKVDLIQYEVYVLTCAYKAAWSFKYLGMVMESIRTMHTSVARTAIDLKPLVKMHYSNANVIIFSFCMKQTTFFLTDIKHKEEGNVLPF